MKYLDNDSLTLLAFVTTITICVLLMLYVTGCSHNIEGYTCKCNCGEKQSTFECNGKEKIVELKGTN